MSNLRPKFPNTHMGCGAPNLEKAKLSVGSRLKLNGNKIYFPMFHIKWFIKI